MRRGWRELLSTCGLGVVLFVPAALLVLAGAYPVREW